VLIDALQLKDPQCIVVDEVLGQMLALLAIDLDRPLGYLIGFGLFRAFDIRKPFPVNLLEKLPRGIGVIADDLMAGLYATLVIYILKNFLNLAL
jgi:phosphatidylglycerophosphatase A